MNSSHNEILRIIAVFKLLKSACLVVVGFGILKLIHQDAGSQLEHWVAMCGFDPGSRLISEAIDKAANLPPHKFKEFSAASFIYAGLFLTEGIGLWRMKRWGEWVTVTITSSLVPLEVYEIFHHPSAIKIFVLLINIAVVVYLVYRMRTESRSVPKKVMARLARPLHSR
jgi:uncharacterized membrane protein (DUF2068 family)